jgi:hypothetical protein
MQGLLQLLVADVRGFQSPHAGTSLDRVEHVHGRFLHEGVGIPPSSPPHVKVGPFLTWAWSVRDRPLKRAGMGGPMCVPRKGRRPKATKREQGDSWAGAMPEMRIPELYNSGILLVGETQTRRRATPVPETGHAFLTSPARPDNMQT